MPTITQSEKNYPLRLLRQILFWTLSVFLGYPPAFAQDAVLVKDINPGANDTRLYHLTNVNGTLYFTTNDGTHGYELWQSNGTTAGTVLVKDIYPGANASDPYDLTNVNGTLYFRADDGIHGRELWKSDGTTAGTVLVKDINPGPNDGSSLWGTLKNMTNVNGTLYFQADDGIHGRELWKSDGTTAGTVLVKDINPGPNDGWPQYLTNVNGTLYFSATDDTYGYELWKSDGTTDGTVMVKDIFPGTPSCVPNYLTNVNGTLYFQGYDGRSGYELWKSDGTTDGTVMVNSNNEGWFPYPYNLTNVNGTLYFRDYDYTHGGELWKSDGTTAGTVMVKDINPGDGSSSNSSRVNEEAMTNVNGTLYFLADDGTHGRELWKSDGTTAGTVMVKDINPGVNNSEPSYLTNVNGTLYFSADDDTHGEQLWKSDGTTAGTVMVKDINPGNNSSSSSNLTNVNGTLYFSAYGGTHGKQLWKVGINQVITFAPLANQFNNAAPFNLSATASSGLPVSFSVVSGPASINGNTLTLTGGLGTVVVRASQGGNLAYNPASLERSFNVTACPSFVLSVSGDASVCGGNATTLMASSQSGFCQSSSLAFDGVDDYLQVGDKASLKMSTEMTMEAWILPTGGGTTTYGGIIINKEGEYEVARFPDGSIRWAFSTTTTPVWQFINTGAIAQLHTWSHVAVSFKAGVVKTYLNGTLVHTHSGTGNISDIHSTQNDFRIGGRQGTTQHFQGAMREVRLWNYERSAASVQADKDGSIAAQSGLVGYWKLNAGSGTTAADASNSGNVATLVNGALWATTPFLSWSPAAGLSATTGTSVVATPSQTTTYTVTATDLDNTTQSREVTVTVTKNPFTLSVSGDASVCGGNATTLTASSQSGFCQSSSLAFDGVDDYLQVGDKASLKMSTEMTMEAWILPTGGGTTTYGGIIINKEGEYEVARFPDGSIRWAFSTTTTPVWQFINTGAIAQLHTWSHVAVSFKAGVVKTYLNGTLVHTYSGTGNIGDIHSTHNDFRIGGRQALAQHFQGAMREVRIWNYERSAASIQAGKDGSIAAQSGLVGYWKLNAGSGTTAADASNSGNVATLVNGALWATTPFLSWSPAAGLSATTGTSVVATPSQTTTYTVTATDLDNTTQSREVTVYTIQCRIGQEEVENTHEVYPNPSTGTVYWTNDKITSVQLYDIAGKLLISQEDKSQVVQQLDAGFLPNGLYLLSLSDGEHTRIWKVIIAK